jgi:Ca-activated chloride channel family protein
MNRRKSPVSQSTSTTTSQVSQTPPTADIAALEVRQDRKLGRARVRSVRYVQVSVTAVPARGGERLPVQIAFAVDRSGSMEGEKLTLAKQALRLALSRLAPQDTFAIAWFGTRGELAVPARAATQAHVDAAIRTCDAIETDGMTALHEGWQLAVQSIQAAMRPGTVARCLLLTDGQANEGVRDPDALAEAARRMRQAGLCTSALGIGADFHEALLAGMANAGDGRFFYAADAKEIPGFVAAELAEAQEVVARRVELVLRPSPGTRIERLGALPNEWTGTELRVLLGDLVADQQVDLALRATLPAGGVGDAVVVQIAVCVDGVEVATLAQEARWTLADHTDNDAQVRQREVDRLVAQQYAAQAKMAAVGLNRDDRGREAEAALRRTAEKIRTYAGDDAELLALVAELLQQGEALRQRSDEGTLKQMYACSSQLSRSKRPDGTSPRRPSA